MALNRKKKVRLFSTVNDITVGANTTADITITLTGSEAGIVKKGDVVRFVGCEDLTNGLLVQGIVPVAANDQIVMRVTNITGLEIEALTKTLYFEVSKT